MKKKIIIFLFFIASAIPSWSQKIDNIPDSYNVEWHSQSKNSSESMPCGGGSIGLNVWVENNELLMYISKSDAFDENNGLDKIGRLRIKITPDPFEGASFKQKLILKDGYIEVKARKGEDTTNINIWVDIFRPVIHVNILSNVNRTATSSYESWRTETFKERPGRTLRIHINGHHSILYILIRITLIFRTTEFFSIIIIKHILFSMLMLSFRVWIM